MDRSSTCYDVAVIGAGMGGLMATALLSKAGLQVCLLESAEQPGGCVVGFDRDGFHFETAIHWLNQCGPNGLVRRVLDYLGPGAPATLPSRRIRRLLGDTHDCLLTTDTEAFREALAAMYPKERRAVDRFFQAAQAVGRSFHGLQRMCRIPQTLSAAQRLRFGVQGLWTALPLMRYAGCSADHGLSSVFPSRALQRVFCSETRLLSCLMPVGWAHQGDFQLPPSGGSRALARWLCDLTESWGAAVHFGTTVERVLVNAGRAGGVRVRHQSDTFDIHARYVIAACDVQSVYERMLPPDFPDGGKRSTLRRAQVYDSCVTLSVGLDCPAQELGLDEEMVLLTRDDVSRQDHSCGDPHKSAVTVVPLSSRDPSLAPAGKGALTIYVSCPIQYGDWWKSERDDHGGFVRGAPYREFKRRYADALIDRVTQRFLPHLRRHVEVLDVATPLTYLRYTGNRNGAIMGFCPTWANIRHRVASYFTPVKNLYIGGQWAEYGGGVPGAVKAGINSALLVLRRENPEAFRSLGEAADG